MNKNVAEYHGIKYSLQPNGMKSRLWIALAFFVTVFGGTLLVSTSVSAADGDVVDDPSSSTSPSPGLASPSSEPSPSPVATPAPVPAATVTVTITKTVVKTVTVSAESTLALAPPLGPMVAPVTATPGPSHTPSVMPQPTMTPASSEEEGSSLAGWALAVVSISALVLLGAGLARVVKRRRYPPRHLADNTTTETITPIPNVDSYNVRDYDPSSGDYDPALGGREDTVQIPRVSSGDDTKVE